MNHLNNRNGLWAALLVLTVPVLAETPNLSGFWELRFDSRNVPPAPLTAAMAAEDRGVQFKLDTTATRWCHFFGVPYVMEGSTIDILQNVNGREIAITSALRNPARHIYTDGRGHVNPDTFDPVSNGHSVGHWEGDTLVVDTTNYRPGLFMQITTEKLHVVEKYTRTGPDSIQWEVTIDDPGAWTKPWTAMIPLRRSKDALYEYACHEGNYGLQGILAGARAEEKTATQKTSSTK